MTKPHLGISSPERDRASGKVVVIIIIIIIILYITVTIIIIMCEFGLFFPLFVFSTEFQFRASYIINHCIFLS